MIKVIYLLQNIKLSSVVGTVQIIDQNVNFLDAIEITEKSLKQRISTFIQLPHVWILFHIAKYRQSGPTKYANRLRSYQL